MSPRVTGWCAGRGEAPEIRGARNYTDQHGDSGLKPKVLRVGTNLRAMVPPTQKRGLAEVRRRRNLGRGG